MTSGARPGAFLEFLPRATTVSPALRSRLERLSRLVHGPTKLLSEVVRDAFEDLSRIAASDVEPPAAALVVADICRLSDVGSQRRSGIEVCFPIQSSGLEAIISIPLEPLRRMARNVLQLPAGCLEAYDVPTELERGAMTYVLARICSNVIESGHPYLAGSPLQQSEVFYQSGEPDASTLGSGEWIVVRGRCRLLGVVGDFTLLFPGEWLTRVCSDLENDARLSRLSRLRVESLSHQLGRAPLEFAVLTGPIELTLAELTTLAAGDVVQLYDACDGTAADTLEIPVTLVPYHTRGELEALEGRALVGPDRAMVRFERIGTLAGFVSDRAAGGLETEQSPRHVIHPANPVLPGSVRSSKSESETTVTYPGGKMSESPPTHPEGPEPQDAAYFPDLPVVLRAEIGRLVLTLGELASLKPGMTIELVPPGNNSVVLHVEGKTVARGELVQVDGQLGIRILDLSV